VTGDGFVRDPLQARALDMAAAADRSGGRLTLDREPFLTQVSLRLDPSLASRSPFPLPLEPNTVTEDGSHEVLWLGPDEWLVLGEPHTGAQIVEALERALAGEHRSVIDVSANRVAVELGGTGRIAVLATGCGLDLHPRSWRGGMCAQTLFAKTHVILQERLNATRMLVRPSFADYLVDRLLVGL